MKKVIFIFLFFPIFLQAQIVNIEKLRTDSLSNKTWAFEAEFSFGVQKNSAGQSLNGTGELRTDYFFNQKNKLLFLGSFGVNRFKEHNNNNESIEIENSQFIHLRYNRKINQWLTWEAFSQGQINEVELVKLRWLIGTGPRFKLLKNKKALIYLGTLYMFEWLDEEVAITNDVIHYRDHRFSNYLSIFYNINKNVSFSHVSYYQPLIRSFKDFRLASETGLEFSISEKLSWTTYFQMIYDSRPPTSTVTFRYQVNNGLVLSF